MRHLKTKIFTKRIDKDDRYVQAIANLFYDDIDRNFIYVEYIELSPKSFNRGLTNEECSMFVPDLQAYADKQNATLYSY